MDDGDIAWLLFFSVGCLAVLAYGLKEARRHRLSSRVIAELFLVMLFGAIAGGRLALALFWQEYSGFSGFISLLLDLNQFHTASSGGVLGAFASAFIYCRLRRISFWRYTDAFSPGFGLGVFFGRIGCFIRGCCQGIESQFWSRFGVSEHPWQLYDALNGLLAFVVVSRLKKRFEGQVLLSYLIMYSSVRILLEFFREDSRILGFTSSQLLYAGILLGAAILWKSKEINTMNPRSLGKVTK